jgi:hypothetical protein
MYHKIIVWILFLLSFQCLFVADITNNGFLSMQRVWNPSMYTSVRNLRKLIQDGYHPTHLNTPLKIYKK